MDEVVASYAWVLNLGGAQLKVGRRKKQIG